MAEFMRKTREQLNETSFRAYGSAHRDHPRGHGEGQFHVGRGQGRLVDDVVKSRAAAKLDEELKKD